MQKSDCFLSPRPMSPVYYVADRLRIALPANLGVLGRMTLKGKVLGVNMMKEKLTALALRAIDKGWDQITVILSMENVKPDQHNNLYLVELSGEVVQMELQHSNRLRLLPVELATDAVRLILNCNPAMDINNIGIVSTSLFLRIHLACALLTSPTFAFSDLMCHSSMPRSWSR